jgi:hypothetical protein
VVGWIIETGIRIGLVSARYMSFFSMEVAIPSLADFPLETAAASWRWRQKGARYHVSTNGVRYG